jgi:hypothetical protein
MFVRRLSIESVNADGVATPCPVKAIDSFCMRNFTNDAVFDDTLPIADGLLEAGLRVPLDLLEERMTDWFRRKRYLSEDETLRVTEVAAPS